MKVQGILPAVVTPLNERGELVEDVYLKLLDKVYAAGSHGIYVAGQTGEGMQLPIPLRKRLAELSVQHSPKQKQVIIHIGASATADAIELARHASSINATAISSLPPAGPWSFGEIKEYYRAVASASQLPVLVYYFPDASPAIRTMEQIQELLTLPNVIGLKYTDFDLYRLSMLTRAGVTVFNGRDEVLVAGLLMGANGGIGTFYNLIPQAFVEVYRLSCAGEWAAARALQDRINDLIALTLQFPMLAAVKQMLTWSGISAGPCAGPRIAQLTPEQSASLRVKLKQSPFPELGGE